MDFGKYLEKCLKKRDISLNAAANMLGVNRGDLYHIIDSKRKLKPEIFKKLIETISFSDIEEKKLTKLFFESYYGAAEFQKIECFVDCLNSFGEKMKVKKINVPEFHGKFALSDSKEILSAVKFICENSESQNITTNFPFENEKLDYLIYGYCKDKTIEKLVHIISFLGDSAEIPNFKRVFAAVKYFYEKQFLYYYYSDGSEETLSVYPYFLTDGKSVVLFNNKNGIFIEDEETVESVNKRAEKMLDDCRVLGGEMPEIFELKDIYVETVMGGPDIYEICPIPCLMCYTDKDFFYSICKKDLPNREFLVNVANDHYSNINKVVNYHQYMTVDGLDFLFKERECLEMPAEYAERMPKETLKRILEKMYTAVEEGMVHFINPKKLNIPTCLQIEINSSGAIINGYIFKEGDSTEKPFWTVIKNKVFIDSLKNFFDYLEKGNFFFSKETTLAYIRNRIVSLEY